MDELLTFTVKKADDETPVLVWDSPGRPLTAEEHQLLAAMRSLHGARGPHPVVPPFLGAGVGDTVTMDDLMTGYVDAMRPLVEAMESLIEELAELANEMLDVFEPLLDAADPEPNRRMPGFGTAVKHTKGERVHLTHEDIFDGIEERDLDDC